MGVRLQTRPHAPPSDIVAHVHLVDESALHQKEALGILYDERYLFIQTPDARRRIESGDPSWEAMVPPSVAEMIRSKKLFGYRVP